MGAGAVGVAVVGGVDVWGAVVGVVAVVGGVDVWGAVVGVVAVRQIQLNKEQ